ncbi:hypothetical protein PIB30_097383, partial [Stylosanthes scabra]|nr:hypothetical protein [Stylosanthes scabra]
KRGEGGEDGVGGVGLGAAVSVVEGRQRRSRGIPKRERKTERWANRVGKTELASPPLPPQSVTATEGSLVAVMAIAPLLLPNRVGERKNDGQRRKDDPFSSPPIAGNSHLRRSGVEQKDECAPSTAIREISLLKEMHQINIVRIICLSKSFVSHCDSKLQPDSISDCSWPCSISLE